jgi:hypothetical protein
LLPLKPCSLLPENPCVLALLPLKP